MTTKKLITIVLFAATAAFAQTTESRMPVTDAEKIADALRAGPVFITKDATLLDWPSTPGGEYRVLRKGSSQWTCLPDMSELINEEIHTTVRATRCGRVTLHTYTAPDDGWQQKEATS
jgi:hypothetical protein